MPGTLTALYQSEMRQATVEPIVQVSIALTSPTSEQLYVSNAHDVTNYNVLTDPLLIGVTAVSEKIDPLKRQYQVSSIEIELVNESRVRALAASHHWFDAGILVTVGTPQMNQSDYATIFSGVVRKVYADYDRVVVVGETRNTRLRSYNSPRTYINLHPSEVLKSVFNDAGIDDGNIDTATFAADHFDVYEHYCFSSYGYAVYNRGNDGTVNYNSGIRFGPDDHYATVGSAGVGNEYQGVGIDVIKVQPQRFAKEYCELTGIVLHNDTAAKVKLTRADPTASVTRHLTVDDYWNFEQDPNTFIYNEVKIHCGTGNDAITVHLKDATSISKFGQHLYETETIYFAPAAFCHESQVASTAVEPNGPGVNGFAGTRNLKTTQVAADTIDSNHPFYGYYRSGYYKTTTAHTDALPTHTADTWSTSSSGTSGTFNRGVMILGISGLSNIGGTGFSNTHARHYYDITVPYQAAERILSRFSNGAPVIKFTTTLEHVDLELGDTISIDNDWFLSPFLGLDGLDSNVKFEIIKKEVMPVGSEIGIDFEACFLIASTSPTVTDAILPPNDLERYPPRSSFGLAADLETTQQTSCHEGVRVGATTGLNFAIGTGTINCGGKTRRLSEASPNIAVTASKHTYVGFDSRTGAVLTNEVATSADEPALAPGEIRLAKVISDGSSITSVVDMRRFGAVSIPQIDKEAFAPGLTVLWNPSFEIWPDPGTACPAWNNNAGSMLSDIFRDEDVTKHGRYSLKMMDTSNNASFTSDEFPVLPGKAYRASVFLRQDHSFTVTAQVQFFQADRSASGTTASVNIHNAALSATNTWEQKSVIALAPGDARFGKIVLSRSANPGGKVYFDDVVLREAPPAFGARLSGDQTVTKNVETLVAFDTKDYDYANAFTATASNYSYTAPEDGLYEINAALVGASSTTLSSSHKMIQRIKKTSGGSTTTISEVYGTVQTGLDQFNSSVSMNLELQFGDVIQVFVLLAVNGTNTVEAGLEKSYFTGRKIS